MNKQPCIMLIRYTLLLIILLSSVTILVILGFDLDLLVNGPNYLSKVIANVLNRVNEEGVVSEDEVSASLKEYTQSLWMYIPMVLLVILSIIILLLNCLGCTGACLLSYSLLSGFCTFTVVVFVFYLSLTLWIFLSDIDNNSVIDSFMVQRIDQYDKTGGILRLIIDSVQRDLQCCGFVSPSDWSKVFPDSCCQNQCPSEGCEDHVSCVLENIHNNTCKQVIKSNLLQPTSIIGIIGVAFIVVLAATGVTAVLSLCLCLAARSYHVKMWRPKNETEGGSNLELRQQLRTHGFLDSD